MQTDGDTIRRLLEDVERERTRRAADPSLEARVKAVKAYQHARFERTYADLLSNPRYAQAARFFLNDLYGPHDFTERDAQFARIVPALVRLFPSDIISTVRSLAELHALSEELDTLMAQQIKGTAPDFEEYRSAWQAIGRRGERLRQIELMLSIGKALDAYTANPLLRHSLRMMRRPAQLAGLGALQSFLETGFDTFRAMRGGAAFLQTIAERETRLAEALFEGGSPPPSEYHA
jgi:hypothetical protein